LGILQQATWALLSTCDALLYFLPPPSSLPIAGSSRSCTPAGFQHRRNANYATTVRGKDDARQTFIMSSKTTGWLAKVQGWNILHRKVARECGGEYLRGRLLPQNSFALTFQLLDHLLFFLCMCICQPVHCGCLQTAARGDAGTTVRHRIFKKSPHTAGPGRPGRPTTSQIVHDGEDARSRP